MDLYGMYLSRVFSGVFIGFGLDCEIWLEWFELDITNSDWFGL